MKPENPFPKGTFLNELMEKDFSNWTIQDIAEKYGKTEGNIRNAIYTIHERTGYRVPHTDGRTLMWKKGRKHKNVN